MSSTLDYTYGLTVDYGITYLEGFTKLRICHATNSIQNVLASHDTWPGYVYIIHQGPHDIEGILTSLVSSDSSASTWNVSITTGDPTQLVNGATTHLSINPTGPGSGEANTASNVGGGEGLFKAKVGTDLQFKSLIPEDAKITVSATGADEVDIGFGSVAINDLSDVNATPAPNDVLTWNNGTMQWEAAPAGGGEVNTASNQGTGVGVFKQKTGVDLEFYTINQGSNMTVTLLPDGIQLDAADQIPAFNSVPNSRISNPGFGYGTLVSPVTLLVTTPVLSNIWVSTSPPNWTLNSAGEVNRANWRLDSVPTGVKDWNIQAVGTIINNVAPAITRGYNLGFTRNGTYLQDSRQAVSVAFNESKNFALQWVGSIAVNDKIEVALMGRSDSVSVLIALCNFNIFPIL